MPEHYPWVRSKNILGVLFRLNICLYQMTFTLLKNEYKVAQEPVLVQKYFCAQVNFPLHIRVLFCGMFIDSLIIMNFAERSLRWLVN
jgi:hypothetical protein